MTEASASWLHGALDLHVHCAPSLFARWGDGLDVARACAAAGMRGLMLKAHHGTTHEVAALLARLHPGLTVAGGIVLNRYVGGVNPAAVEAALRTGGSCVWFPTIDARGHARAFGSTGAYPAQRGGLESGPGIAIVDERGRLAPEAADVLSLCAEHGALVATGHLDAGEIDALARAAGQAGVERLLVNHPCFPVPALSDGAVDALVARGAVIELTWLSVSPAWEGCTLARCAHLLARAGADHVVIASDAGQRDSPPPPDALASFAQALHEHGVPERAVRRALTDVPARLIGVDLVATV